MLAIYRYGLLPCRMSSFLAPHSRSPVVSRAVGRAKRAVGPVGMKGRCVRNSVLIYISQSISLSIITNDDPSSQPVVALRRPSTPARCTGPWLDMLRQTRNQLRTLILFVNPWVHLHVLTSSFLHSFCSSHYCLDETTIADGVLVTTPPPGSVLATDRGYWSSRSICTAAQSVCSSASGERGKVSQLICVELCR